ncbi:MAG TPA: cupin domain-containing protein [Thermoplasmata archaeon]|nr:cupin domain-containing protein [Thermoplasmata archaeon]
MTPFSDAPSERSSKRPLHVMGVTMFVRLTGGETEGAYSLMEHVFPPGAGPAFLHSHPAQETILVREGKFEAYSKGVKGRETTRLGPGDLHHVASRGAHGLKNVGEVQGRAHIVFHPADLQEKLFFEFDELISRSNGVVDPAARDALFARHGLVLLERPPAP